MSLKDVRQFTKELERLGARVEQPHRNGVWHVFVGQRFAGSFSAKLHGSKRRNILAQVKRGRR